jgi:ABC-type antimicrobial peptide transport system permease subunit
MKQPPMLSAIGVALGTAVTLATTAVVAAWLTAGQAAAIDPIRALRTE